MNIEKRNALVEKLNSEPEPQLVPVDEFFDGNDDIGSIGCNLPEHPGIDAFRTALARLKERDDVVAVYAQIAEIDPGEDCWPFADTVFVVGWLSSEDLAAELEALEPDEVGSAEYFGVPEQLLHKHKEPVLAAWWD